MKAVRGSVKGQVQGVGFRFFTRGAAEKLKVSGWVKNVMNGSVEFFAQGNENDVDALVTQLKRGPPGSRVEKLFVEKESPDPNFSSFEIKHDY